MEPTAVPGLMAHFGAWRDGGRIGRPCGDDLLLAGWRYTRKMGPRAPVVVPWKNILLIL